MASDLSDSSADEEEQYTTTNIMLGYASKEPTDDSVSQLGGFPTWLEDQPPSASLAKCKTCNSMMALLLQLNGDLPEYFPGHERRLYVFACRNKPCRRKSGSIRAIRGTKVAPSTRKDSSQPSHTSTRTTFPQSKSPALTLGDSIFISNPPNETPANPNPFSTSHPHMNANPYSTKAADPVPYGHQRKQHFTIPTNPPPPPPDRTTTTSSETSILPQTFAQKARISTPPPPESPNQEPPSRPTPFPSPSLLPSPYPTYHLSADYETLDFPSPSPSSTPHPHLSQPKEDLTKTEDDDPHSWLSPSTKADSTFLRFASRLAQNAEQVLRYEFGGRPLLYSKNDEVARAFPTSSSLFTAISKIATSPASNAINPTTATNPKNHIPKCENCGSGRVFEFQLTPHAISELEAEEEGLGMEGMEWGTVVVGVCGGDCVGKDVREGKVGWVEEWVGVCWEEG